MKILYFEGAGAVPRGDVPNCRIRTAFHLDNGKALYLEIIGTEVTKHTPDRLKCYTNSAHIDHCYYIHDTGEDGHTIHKCERSVNFEYSMPQILKFVNSLGASFDRVCILPDLAGYRVHGGHKTYNFADEFSFDPELTAKRLRIRSAIYDLELVERERDKATNGKRFVHSPGSKSYPNFSLWVDNEDPKILHLLRHFNGFNKHWMIDATAENWQKSMQELPPGKNSWCAWK